MAYPNTFTTRLVNQFPFEAKHCFLLECIFFFFGRAKQIGRILWFIKATQTWEMCGRESASTFHPYNQNLYASRVASDLFWLSVGVQTCEWRGWRGRKGRTASETSGSCLTLHLFYALCVLIGSYCWWDKCVDKLALIYEVLGHSQCRAVTECVRGLGRDPYSTPLALWRLLLISCTFINSASLLVFIEQMCETPGNFWLRTLSLSVTCNQVFVFRGIAHASDGAHTTPGAFWL